MQEIGVDANFVCLNESTLATYAETSRSFSIRAFIRAYKNFHESRCQSRFSAGRYAATLSLIWSRLVVIAWISLTADAVVFKSGQSLSASGIDIKLYKACGVRVIFIFHGSDSRPPYLNAFYARRPVELLQNWTVGTEKAVARLAGMADYVIDNPAGAHFHKDERCVLYQVLGNPIDDERIATSSGAPSGAAPESNKRGLRVLHAPSLAELKGSDLIRACIERLRNEGYPIDYVELSGVSNSAVIAEIRKADLVIDEMYSDIHGATLAMEATACGCPVVVGGYCFDQLEKIVPKEFIPPTITCRPEHLFETVKSLIDEPERLKDYRRRALEFYARVGSARETAKRLLVLIEGKAPKEWFFNVQENRLVGVVAGPPAAALKNIRSLQEKYGAGALLLQDKPELARDLPRIVEGL